MEFLKSNNLLIGLILIGVIAMIYEYYYRAPIKGDNLISINGRLAEKPIESSTGGDMTYYYIKFSLIGIPEPYYLKNCGYSSVDKDFVLSLEKGDSVSFKIMQSDLKNKNELIVYTFSTKQKPDILSLKSFNHCHVNAWKTLRPILLIMLLMLSVRIFQSLGLLSFLKKKNIEK